MGHVDLFGFGRQALQEGLHGPGFALAGALPKQGGGLFGSALLDQTGIETFFESQAAACNAGRIAGLSRLPSVAISLFKFALWIAGLAGFEFGVICHWACSQFVEEAGSWKEFETYPDCMAGTSGMGTGLSSLN